MHNSKYTGKVVHDGVEYDNIYPRIISDELWYKVNNINEENLVSPGRKKEIYDYILSGKLMCGVCKHKMNGDSGTSKPAKYTIIISAFPNAKSASTAPLRR